MPRKPSGVPKQKNPPTLHLATHAPTDDTDLFHHVEAGWGAMKLDTKHFPTPPSGADMDQSLTDLGDALKGSPNGGPVDHKLVKQAATKVRLYWDQMASYAQIALRGLPPEEIPPILAAVLLYKSGTGTHKPKPPILAKHGPTSGTVLVIALAIVGALTYTFEWSLDQTNWSPLQSGKTRVTISGLTPGKLYWFRVRAFLRDGTTTDPVHAVSLIVV